MTTRAAGGSSNLRLAQELASRYRHYGIGGTLAPGGDLTMERLVVEARAATRRADPAGGSCLGLPRVRRIDYPGRASMGVVRAVASWRGWWPRHHLAAPDLVRCVRPTSPRMAWRGLVFALGGESGSARRGRRRVGGKAALHAIIGPVVPGGVALSAHNDYVPVEARPGPPPLHAAPGGWAAGRPQRHKGSWDAAVTGRTGHSQTTAPPTRWRRRPGGRLLKAGAARRDGPPRGLELPDHGAPAPSRRQHPQHRADPAEFVFEVRSVPGDRRRAAPAHLAERVLPAARVAPGAG
jgi:hypothetical protein